MWEGAHPQEVAIHSCCAWGEKALHISRSQPLHAAPVCKKVCCLHNEKNEKNASGWSWCHPCQDFRRIAADTTPHQSYSTSIHYSYMCRNRPSETVSYPHWTGT